MSDFNFVQYSMLFMGVVGVFATLWLGYRALWPPERREKERRNQDRRSYNRGGSDRRQLGRRK